MYAIGEFSKINRITTKTLRHYNKLGLFEPSYINEFTRYRYYTANQLPKLRQILDLKAMGFSLEEIKVLINHETDLEFYLAKKVKELKLLIETNELQLFKAEIYLNQIQGEQTMENQITLKSLPEVCVASMRTIIPNYDAYFEIVPKMGETMRSVGAVCSLPAYCFTIYHDGEFKETELDVEICEAVNQPCEDTEQVKFKTIEGVAKAACIQYQGPYSGIGDGYSQLFAWISENSYEVIGNPRESYIDGIWNQENPSNWLTEIQVPIQ